MTRSDMVMNLKALRARCEARLRDVEIPAPFDVWTFCGGLARRRRRPIVLRPVVSRLGPCGVWLALSTEDLILFEQETSRLHQQHIILHEVGHLLCEHQGELLSAAEELQLLLPSLNPGMVRHVLHRNVHSTEEEREAELLAAMIVERAGQSSLVFPQAVTRRPDTDLTATSLRRLEAALDGGLSAIADLANR